MPVVAGVLLFLLTRFTEMASKKQKRVEQRESIVVEDMPKPVLGERAFSSWCRLTFSCFTDPVYRSGQ